mgnify:CR=1 FL=1
MKIILNIKDLKSFDGRLPELEDILKVAIYEITSNREEGELTDWAGNKVGNYLVKYSQKERS